VCNFAAETRREPCSGSVVTLHTHEGAPPLADGQVELGPLSGALIR
jgi:hypothetical protein